MPSGWTTYADGIDVGLVSKEGLFGRFLSHVPQTASLVHGASDVGVVVRAKWDADHVSTMRVEFHRLLAGFHVPMAAENFLFVLKIFPGLIWLRVHFHIAGAGDEFIVVNEAAGGQETLVTQQLSQHLGGAGGAVAIIHVVNCAHVVHTTAS